MRVSRAELIDQARDFAAKTQDLLNGTVTTGIRIGAILDATRGLCYVGYGITRADPVPIQAVPLKIGRAPADCFLELAHFLRMDDEGVYLTDLRASFGLYAMTSPTRCTDHTKPERDASEHRIAPLATLDLDFDLGLERVRVQL